MKNNAPLINSTMIMGIINGAVICPVFLLTGYQEFFIYSDKLTQK